MARTAYTQERRMGCEKPFQTGIRAVLAVICIGAVLTAAIYGYGILQGWFLLNNPSRKLYPIRGVGCIPLPGRD